MLSVDLRTPNNIIENQGNLGDCVPSSATEVYQLMASRDGVNVALSPIALYYWTQQYENFKYSSGVNAPDALYVFQHTGDYLDSTFPESVYPMGGVPPANAITEASHYTITSWSYLDNSQPWAVELDQIKAAVNSGHPVMFDTYVTQNFMIATENNVPWNQMPSFDYMPSITNTWVGSHELVIEGYDDASQMFLVQQSWGSGYGNNGYIGLSYYDLIHTYQTGYVINSINYNGQTLNAVSTGVQDTQETIFQKMVTAAQTTYGMNPQTPISAYHEFFFTSYTDSVLGAGQYLLGIDTITLHLETYHNGVYTDIGPESQWLTTLGVHPQ